MPINKILFFAEIIKNKDEEEFKLNKFSEKLNMKKKLNGNSMMKK